MRADTHTAIPAEKNDVLGYAEFRLNGWGYWLRAIAAPGPRHVSKSNFVVVPSGVTEYDDPEAEVIEKITAGMMNNPRQYVQYLVLLCHYVQRVEGARDGAAVIRHHHPELRMNKDKYMVELEKARAYIAGVLSVGG